MRSSLSSVVSAYSSSVVGRARRPPTPPHAPRIEAFMRSAKVTAVRESSKGVTRPLRLTLVGRHVHSRRVVPGHRRAQGR